MMGIAPESKQAPKAMKEAIELFFGMKSGDGRGLPASGGAEGDQGQG
jgi:hypothetical protein